MVVFPVRRLAKENEVLHHKQKRRVGGKIYKISKIWSPKEAKAAHTCGFTDIKVKKRWKSIRDFMQEDHSHGGIRCTKTKNGRSSEEPVRKRPRHIACLHPSSGVLLAKPAAAMPKSKKGFNFAKTPFLCVNLREDAESRAAVKVELLALSPLFLRFVVGCAARDYVQTATRCSNNLHCCTLELNRAGRDLFGVNRIEMVCKNPKKAIGAFGCAMAHRSAMDSGRVGGRGSDATFPGDEESYFCIFEDDVYNKYAPDVTVKIAEKLLALCSSSELPEIVYLGGTSIKSAEEILSSFNFPTIGCVKLVRTKSGYGTFALLVKRCVASLAMKFWDVNDKVALSDAALRNLIVCKSVRAAHFELGGKQRQVFLVQRILITSHLMPLLGGVVRSKSPKA